MSDSRSRTIAGAAMLFALVALLAPVAEGQEKIAIGERHTVQSKILNEARPILVSLPDGYGQRQDRYPVVYLLDGDVHLEHVNGLVKFLAWAGQVPRMIVVGVANTDRMRDFSLKPYPGRPGSGGAGRFLEFLATELIPFVDKTYPTMPRRMLVGHSLC